MSVRIRLARVGRKKVPHYRIVVMDSRARRDGAYIEQIGVYHPKSEPARVSINEQSALEWLRKGAEPTETVRNLLKHQGVLLRFSLGKGASSPEKIEEAMSKWRERVSTRSAKSAAARSRRKGKAEAPVSES